MSIDGVKIDLSADLKWARTHIILVLVYSAIAFGAVYGIETLLSHRAADTDQKWSVILATSRQQISDLESQLKTHDAEYAAENLSLLAANQKLAAVVVSRGTELQTQLKKDNTLSALDTAAKLGGTVNGTDIVLPLPTGRNLAGSLDTLSSTQADLQNVQTELTNETEVAANLQKSGDEKDALLSAMRTQAVDQDKACKAEIAAVKSAARKSKLKWFGIGIVVGLIGGRWL